MQARQVHILHYTYQLYTVHRKNGDRVAKIVHRTNRILARIGFALAILSLFSLYCIFHTVFKICWVTKIDLESK